MIVSSIFVGAGGAAIGGGLVIIDRWYNDPWLAAGCFAAVVLLTARGRSTASSTLRSAARWWSSALSPSG